MGVTMRVYALAIGTSIAVGLILLLGMTTCVDIVNTKESTTLEKVNEIIDGVRE
jgi:hypothetical protein